MQTPIDTLVQLNEIILGLDRIQSWIDHARTAAATNQRVQLELDRQQTRVDDRRKLVKMLMIDIASRN